MKGLMFYVYASAGSVSVLSSLGLVPDLFSVKWWFLVIGLGLLMNAFKPAEHE